MKRYAVGVCHFDEDNTVKIVEAEDELFAMVKAVGNQEAWRINENELPFKTVDEGITFYLQGDVAVSVPVEI